MIKKMKANKGPGQSTGNWIIDCHSHYDWHSLMFKNASRNYVHFTQASYIEDHLTSKHCKKMLQKLDSMAFIQQELKSLLSSHAKSRKALVPGQSTSMKIIKEYLFPNGITLAKKNIEKIMVNITDLILTQDTKKVIKTQCQALLNLMKHIENAPFVVARPGAMLLTLNTSWKLKALKKVLIISPLIHSNIHNFF